MNKITKFSLILLGSLFIFFAKVPVAYACKCARLLPGPLGVLKAFGDNDAVFTGKVIDTKLESDKDNYELKVDIFKPYKYSGELTRIKIFTNDPNGTTCGYPARKGKEYLFYADETQKGDFTINNCSRTGELANRMEDISFLNKWRSFIFVAFSSILTTIIFFLGRFVVSKIRKTKLKK